MTKHQQYEIIKSRNEKGVRTMKRVAQKAKSYRARQKRFERKERERMYSSVMTESERQYRQMKKELKEEYDY